MAKLDFSSLKTADLRSVAPVDESAIPRAQPLSEPEGAVYVSAQPEPVQVPVSAASAHPVQSVAVSTPAAPVSKSPIHAVSSAKKISLTSLKTGGSSVVARTSEASVAPAPTAAPAVAVHRAPTVAVSTVSKRSATTISLGTKPAVSAPAPVTEARSPIEEPVTDGVDVISESVAEGSDDDGRALIEGVDIIQAAKVIGTEGESLANEILTESLKDPEAAKKEAEEKAVAAVVIPETEKVFFPNLEMDDDFFDDPLFEGIVPPKPEKKPEVRQPIEMKKEGSVAEPVVAAPSQESSETDVKEIPKAAIEEVPVGEISEEAPVAVSETDGTSVVPEPVQETVASEKTDTSVVEPISEIPSETPVEAYVETVAKDLSMERKGGLAKLFGERKVLVRAMAGFFAVAILGAGAFSFVSPSIKTSGPEAMNTGSELSSTGGYVPAGETKILGEGVRVFTGRRPNVHKNRKSSSIANSGAVVSSWAVSSSGILALPVSDTGSSASGSESPTQVLDASGALEPSAGTVSEGVPPPSPVVSEVPTNAGAAEAPQPTEAPAPQADMPPAPMPN